MSKDDVLSVTCPNCGRIHQKSFFTNSVIICDGCKKPYWVLVDEGFCLTAKLENKSMVLPDVKKMARYSEKLNDLIRSVM